MSLNNTSTKSIVLSGWIENDLAKTKTNAKRSFSWKSVDLLKPLRMRLNSIEIDRPKLAHRICRLIPARCPFARKIRLFGRTIANIPPLCKINPLYEDLMALRFRALCYLADECGEDISAYC
ncbi:MAG: Mo-dependent nitrogenase C-terminal domain-containing protein [Hydrococcus sp. C42_A2020_068]|uniref:Mo-dependent nitrogenase C-terminal domain-containing protein n=1 Tax=Pleurocapsa sp. PCC 7327 TaxID=118163 RepID=UPI00029FC642|nr:Mo-dependent nitrogenase C-terminal domain-containing protein [Pleurocapsa sp. PCC 7327]AFY76553.1 Mo-dependent nitrogenase [Pleurocapsa sp. PCC 7327]MBF2022581.1 Mo-dependent nitrogenase C-terminal domain-containing protein [Hydrococcus sp. C42_A2020_068]